MFCFQVSYILHRVCTADRIMLHVSKDHSVPTSDILTIVLYGHTENGQSKLFT